MIEYNLLDLYPYFLLFIGLLFCYKFIPNKKNKFISVIILTFLFSACRYNVGWDYLNYVKIIRQGINLEDDRFELIPRYIFYIANKWNFYPFAFISLTIIQMFFLAKSIKQNSSDPALSWLIYVLFPLFFLNDLSTIRQGVAASIVFFSYNYAKNRKIIKFILTISFASLFHKSALYGFIIFPLLLKQLPISLNWILFITSFFLGETVKYVIQNIDLSFLSDKINIYFKAELFSSAKTSTLNYVYALFNVFILLNYKRLSNINKNNAFFIQLANWGMITFNVLTFEPVSSIRLSVLFFLFWLPLIPSLSKIYSKTIILIPFIFLHFIYLWIYINSYNNRILEKVSFIPYDVWWNHLI